MKKRMPLIMMGLIMLVLLGGCVKAEAPAPVEEAKLSAAELLVNHRARIETDSQAVMVIEEEEIEITDRADLIESLQYDQWKEMQEEEVVTILTVFFGGDELSFFENGRVRLWTGIQDAWFQIPETVLGELQEIWNMAMMPKEEVFVFDEIWMWNNYFYETITSIGNADSFSAEDLSEIDEIVEYVWYRYSHTFNRAEEMGFDHSPDISSYYLFPREIAYQEASEVFAFDLSQADLSESYTYLPEFDAFQMHYVEPRREDEISGNNSWAIYYDGARPLEENRYEVRMIAYVDKEAGIIDRENIYTIRVNEAGTILFESGEIRMPVYPLSDFSQELLPLDGWKDVIGGYSRMIGESEEEIFFYEYENGAKITRVQKADLNQLETQVLKWEEQESLLQMHVSADGNQFIACTSHYVRSYNHDWEEEQTVPLPAFLIEKIMSETIWDDFAPSSIFTGYDVTDDLSRIVYGDEEGLKIFGLVENPAIELLEKSEVYPADDLSPVSVYQAPRFVDQGQKIFVVRSGYEGNRGIALFDLKTEDMKRYDHGWYIWTNEMRADHGVFIPNEYVHNWDTGEGTIKHFFLDFDSGEVESFSFDRMGGNDMPEGGEFYHGENGLAMIARDYNEASMGGYTTYVQQVDLKTKEVLVETKIKAARIRIMGMDREGNIYLHYYYNQDSQGFGLLPKAVE